MRKHKQEQAKPGNPRAAPKEPLVSTGISKEIMKAHYIEYASQPDEWVANMEITKKSIVRKVLETAGFQSAESVKAVVLGASDKRYIPIHQRIFENLLQKTVDMATFDIDTEHLGRQRGVVEHDVRESFPNVPWGIIFSHELMKFLVPEDQLLTIKNSYDALADNGLAMHIVHSPSIKGTAELREWQHRVDPDALLEQLKKEGIPAKKLVFESESDVDWLRETTVIMIRK